MHVPAHPALNVRDEAHDSLSRAKVLAPYVEIVLASGDVGAARVAAEELSAVAAGINAPILLALSSYANGAVLLAAGDAGAALAAARRAWAGWRELEAPLRCGACACPDRARMSETR